MTEIIIRYYSTWCHYSFNNDDEWIRRTINNNKIMKHNILMKMPLYCNGLQSARALSVINLIIIINCKLNAAISDWWCVFISWCCLGCSQDACTVCYCTSNDDDLAGDFLDCSSSQLTQIPCNIPPSATYMCVYPVVLVNWYLRSLSLLKLIIIMAFIKCRRIINK